MEAINNPLLSTQNVKQPGPASLAGDLFAIESGKLSAVQKDGNDSFSDMLQKKMDKPEPKQQTSHQKEEQNRVSNQKREDATAEARAEKEARAEVHAEREGKAEKAEKADNTEHSAETNEGRGQLLARQLDETALDEEDVTGEELLSEELAALDSEVDPDAGIAEEALTLQQQAIGSQEEAAEIIAPQVAAAQQPAKEAEAEVDEQVEEGNPDVDDALRSTRREGRGGNSALPPELQKGEQPILMKDEAKQAMQQAMQQAQANVAEQAKHPDMDGAGIPLAGFDPVQGGSAEKPVQLRGMPVPPQSRQWASELGERVLFMAGKKIQSAEIRLNPPNMGLLEVKLSISGDQAQLVFQSGNANVRDVLESSVPKIREMLEQQGITLTDVNVGHREQRQQAGQQEGEGHHSAANQGLDGAGEGVEEGEVVSASAMAVDRIGLVNYYA